MEDALKIDGFDEAILGVAYIWQEKQRAHVFVYSGEIITKILMDRDGMSDEEALEYIDFNIEGAYVGPSTPVIVWELNE